MESALDAWRARSGDSWIAGCAAAELRAAVERQRNRLERESGPPVHVINADEPVRWAVEFCAAVTSTRPLRVVLGPRLPPAIDGLREPEQTEILIATGGTSGAPRWAVHTGETLSAAARGLQSALGGGPISSLCFLPLEHVSGLMQVVRALVSGGAVTFVDGRALRAGRFPPVPVGAVTSAVPTQLARLLEVPGGIEWLRSFRAVFLGGGPAWPDLLNRARAAGIPLAPCYGMTETAAQVTLLPPGEFLAGREDVGRPLPHAAVEIVDPATEETLGRGCVGRIRVRCASLFLGYIPGERHETDAFLTSDQGELTADGHLCVQGRADAVVITGGEKVDPVEVEAAIRATGLVDDVAVVGVPDREWGEAVVAVIAGAAPGMEGELAARVRQVLSPAARPKRWVRVAELPRTGAGKVDRQALLRLIASAPSA